MELRLRLTGVRAAEVAQKLLEGGECKSATADPNGGWVVDFGSLDPTPGANEDDIAQTNAFATAIVDGLAAMPGITVAKLED